MPNFDSYACVFPIIEDFFFNLVDAIKLRKDYKVAWNQVPLRGKMAKSTTWLASFAERFLPFIPTAEPGP